MQKAVAIVLMEHEFEALLQALRRDMFVLRYCQPGNDREDDARQDIRLLEALQPKSHTPSSPVPATAGTAGTATAAGAG